MKTKFNPMILLLGAVLLAASLACQLLAPDRNESPASALPETEAGESVKGGNTITVTEDDFSVTIEPTQASAGEVTIVVQNKGHLPHDFRIYGQGVDRKTSMIEPQESETLTLQLEPGTYDYECTVEGHAMLGMRGTFTVEESKFE